MRIDSKRVRLLFTLAFVAIGALTGNALARVYFTYLNAVIRGEAYDVLGIMRMPFRLSVSDKNVLLLVFVVVGALVGFILDFLAYHQLERGRKRWEEMAPQDKLVMFGGLLLGLILTVLLRSILGIPAWISVAAAILLCYVSVVALESVKEQMHFYFPGSVQASKTVSEQRSRPKLLDTNVIIDGRIADICRAGFIEGPIYIPRFVLEELQQIADSSDNLKRARGRRGLEILNQMKKELDLQVPHFDTIDASVEVDARLVIAAHSIGGVIITNDYNLNKVAELQGVVVLNINELANAVKPVVLPGEEMRITIIKEGKEKEQGIGYLDDGTMIVVEGARRMIGDTLGINVTSVLQTVQGKMIFGKVRDNDEMEDSGVEESVRTYTGGRPRRKVR